MPSNFPTALDDDTSLTLVVDGTTTVVAAHHNNLKDSTKLIQAKLGIFNTTVPTSLDYRLGHPSLGHIHNAASGHGPRIAASDLIGIASYLAPSYLAGNMEATRLIGIASYLAPSYLAGNMEATKLIGIASYLAASYIPTPTARTFIQISKAATMIVGSNVAGPVVLGRTLQLQSIQAAFRSGPGPSGATTALDILIGPTSIYEASQLFRPIWANGASVYRSSATPNLITYPSGAVITLDVDAVATDPGQDLTITLIFRD